MGKYYFGRLHRAGLPSNYYSAAFFLLTPYDILLSLGLIAIKFLLSSWGLEIYRSVNHDFPSLTFDRIRMQR